LLVVVAFALGWVREAAAQVGPSVTFFGPVNVQGMPLPCSGSTPEGVSICPVANGSGFLLVVEGRPSSAPVGTTTFDPDGLPDLQIQVDEPLGNGSPAVCDNQAPSAGGVAPVSPPDLNFSDRGPVNDFACRFSAEPCILDQFGEPRFLDSRSTVQFCATIDSVIGFVSVDNLISLRLRDTDRHVGVVRQLVVRVGSAPTSTPTASATATGGTPTPTRTPMASPTRTATATSTASPGSSPTSTPTTLVAGSPTSTPTRTTTSAVSPTPTPTVSPTTPTATPTGPLPCAGDCDRNGTVDVPELIQGVRITLGSLDLAACFELDANGDRRVTVNEPVRAVHHALNDCPE
jgi:hypothetical protein